MDLVLNEIRITPAIKESGLSLDSIVNISDGAYTVHDPWPYQQKLIESRLIEQARVHDCHVYRVNCSKVFELIHGTVPNYTYIYFIGKTEWDI